MMYVRSMMTASLIALLGGCVSGSEYCDIASPMYFESSDTVSWLLHNDRTLLVEIIVHNETTDRLCRSEGP